MDSVNCKYHPLSTANFYCLQCELNFCNTCSNENDLRSNHSGLLQCVLCESPLEQLEHASDIEPFWHNLKSIYFYPLTKASIVISLLASALAAMTGIFFLFLLFAILLITYFSFLCLEKTASGNLNAANFDDIFDINTSSQSATGLFGVLICMFIIISISAKIFGPGFATLIYIFFIFSFPASVISLAIDKKVFRAINPLNLLSIIMTTGKSYLIMIVFLFIMMSSQGLINSYLFAESLSAFAIFINFLVVCYYTIIMFHIMGHIVYQNRHTIAFAIDDKELDFDIRDQKKQRQDNIETLVKAGHYGKAAGMCVSSLDKKNSSLWDWKQAFTLVLLSREDKKVSGFINYYFETLYEKNEFDLLADSYLSASRRLPKFKPDNHKVWLTTAKSLMEIGHYKKAVSMVSNFDKSCKDRPLVIEVYQLISDCLTKIPGYENKAIQYSKMAQSLKA